MNVKYFLSCIFTTVQDQSVTILLESLLAGNGGGEEQHLTHQRDVAILQF